MLMELLQVILAKCFTPCQILSLSISSRQGRLPFQFRLLVGKTMALEFSDVLHLVKLIMLFFLLVIPLANGLSRTSGDQLGVKVVILELLEHLQTIVK